MPEYTVDTRWEHNPSTDWGVTCRTDEGWLVGTGLRFKDFENKAAELKSMGARLIHFFPTFAVFNARDVLL